MHFQRWTKKWIRQHTHTHKTYLVQTDRIFKNSWQHFDVTPISSGRHGVCGGGGEETHLITPLVSSPPPPTTLVYQSQSPFVKQRLPCTNSIAVKYDSALIGMRPLTEWQLTSVRLATVHYGAAGSCSVWQQIRSRPWCDETQIQPCNNSSNRNIWERRWWASDVCM